MVDERSVCLSAASAAKTALPPLVVPGEPEPVDLPACQPLPAWALLGQLGQSHQPLGEDPCPPCPPAGIRVDARQAADACFGDFLIGEMKDGAGLSPFVWGFTDEAASLSREGTRSHT